MPTYVYRCQQCGAKLERRQSFQDPPLTECEVCSGELRRVLQPVSVIYRGSGFYTTDYRAKSSTDGEPTTTSPSDGDKGSSDKGSSDKGSSSDSTSTSAPAKTETAASSAAASETPKSS